MIRRLGQLEENFLSFLLVGMTLLVFMEVILRFGFGTGALWIQELTLHTSAWFVLFGASYGVKVGAHIGVDAFIKLFGSETRRLLSLLAVALCLAYCALFLIGGWTYLTTSYKIGLFLEDIRVPGFLVSLIPTEFAEDVLRIDSEDPLMPTWFAHGPIVVGFVLLGVRFIELARKLISGETDSLHLADEVKEVLERKQEDGSEGGVQ